MPVHPTHARSKEIRLVPRSTGSTGRFIVPMALRQEYSWTPTGKTQARFAGRRQLRPALDLKDYRFEAVVDYLKFRVTTDRSMDPKNLKRQITARGVNNNGVTAIFGEDEAGPRSTIFDLRMDDPTPADLVKAIAIINATPGLATDGALQLLEVSVDVYPEDHSSDGPRLLMSDLLRRHFLPAEVQWRYPGGWPRWAGAERQSGFILGKDMPEDEFDERVRLVEGHGELPVNTTIYIGGLNAGPLMMRVMDKVIDRQKRGGGFDLLEPDQRRSRIEVELRREELNVLGLNKIDDLYGFKFGKLRADLFDFAIPTFAFDERKVLAAGITAARRILELAVFERSGVLGLTHMQKAGLVHRNSTRARRLASGLSAAPRVRNGFGRNGFSLDYVELNRAVDEAFAGLVRRWKKPTR